MSDNEHNEKNTAGEESQQQAGNEDFPIEEQQLNEQGSLDIDPPAEEPVVDNAVDEVVSEKPHAEESTNAVEPPSNEPIAGQPGEQPEPSENKPASEQQAEEAISAVEPSANQLAVENQSEKPISDKESKTDTQGFVSGQPVEEQVAVQQGSEILAEVEGKPADVKQTDSIQQTTLNYNEFPTGNNTGEGRARSTEQTSSEQNDWQEANSSGVSTDSMSDPTQSKTENSYQPTATVKFVLMPSGQVATMRCNLDQRLEELKHHFGRELKMPEEFLVFLFNGKSLGDEASLGDLGVGPNGTVQLEMQSSDPVNHPIKPIAPRQEYVMPDVITVRVQNFIGEFSDVVVEIERSTGRKPFLGGYRHKSKGIEYHHASAQTLPKARPPPAVERFCRDTQTVRSKHTPQQTTNTTSTQMTKIGVYVSNMQDKLLVPGQYTTADEHEHSKLKNIVIIQKYYRRWLAKKIVDKIRTDRLERLEWERSEEYRKKKEKENRIRLEFERRMNPKTKEDFDLLYHALEKWRLEELDRINSTLTGAERKAALCQLLEQETELIASIGRHKLDSNEINKQKNIQKFLEDAAAPKKWKGPDGKVTQMDTPFTLRAKQLQEIYNGINMKYLTQDERLDVLLTLKHTVKEHECKLTQEIIELIDREADLLMRGTKESHLAGLRKRISTLFLQYIKTPMFNPEAAHLLKLPQHNLVPQDPSKLRKDIHFCSGCNQYLPSSDFQLSTNTRRVGRCRKCTKMDNEATIRQDYSNYRYMLNGLRTAEEGYSDGSKIAFLLQEHDLRYLVENVWNSQSALSAWDDIYDLVLVRWDNKEEWSPWNCVLLTKEEASAHEKLADLEEAYGKHFVHKIQNKHTLAHNYFSRLPGMSEQVRKSANKGKASKPGSSSAKGLHIQAQVKVQ